MSIAQLSNAPYLNISCNSLTTVENINTLDMFAENIQVTNNFGVTNDMSCRGDATFNIIEVVNHSLGYDYLLPRSQPTAGQVITATSGAQCIWADGGGGGGGVTSVTSGDSNINVNNMDVETPIITMNSTIAPTTVNTTNLSIHGKTIQDPTTASVNQVLSINSGGNMMWVNPPSGSGTIENMDGNLSISTPSAGTTAINLKTGQNNFITPSNLITGSTNANANGNVNVGYGITQGSGINNVMLGSFACTDTTTASSNVMIGQQTGRKLTTGDCNVGIGAISLYWVGANNYNSAYGNGAMSGVGGDLNTTSVNNSGFGSNAGSTFVNGSNNLFLGANSQPTATTISGQCVLGDSNLTKLSAPGMYIDFGDTVSGALTLNKGLSGQYTFPTTIGTTNQVLSVGSGSQLAWHTVSGGGGVNSVNSGSSISVNNTDSSNPIINLASTITPTTINSTNISTTNLTVNSQTFQNPTSGRIGTVLKLNSSKNMVWENPVTNNSQTNNGLSLQGGYSCGSNPTVSKLNVNNVMGYDFTNVTSVCNGFVASVYDGYQFIYFIGKLTPTLMRYDTTLPFNSASSYVSINVATIYPLVGYFGCAVYDGLRYLYLLPYAGSSTSTWVQFDTTQPLTNNSAYNVFDLSAVDSHLYSIVSSGFDGRYIYMGLQYDGTSSYYCGRYDTTLSFTSLSSYQIVGITGGALSASSAILYDGRYVYFIPSNSSLSTGFVRYDTTESFTSGSSFESFNLTYGGWSGGCFTGRYIILCNYVGNHIAQYDITKAFSNSNIAYYDLTVSGYSGAIFDGRYVYITNNNSSDGNIAVWDITQSFTSDLSYYFVNLTSIVTGAVGFNGGCIANGKIYFCPLIVESTMSGAHIGIMAQGYNNVNLGAIQLLLS